MANEKKNNKEKMLDYLQEYGSITTFQSVSLLWIMNPQETVRRLRKDGHNITTEFAKNSNGKRFARYILKDK